MSAQFIQPLLLYKSNTLFYNWGIVMIKSKNQY